MSAIAAIKASTILGSTIRSTDAGIGFNKTYDPMGFNIQGWHAGVTAVVVLLWVTRRTLYLYGNRLRRAVFIKCQVS